MSNNKEKIFQELTLAILELDSHKTRSILASIEFSNADLNDQNFLHLSCEVYGNKGEETEVSDNFGYFMINFDIIFMLLDAGVNIEEKDEYGNTCLFYAIKKKNSALCEILLQSGADMWTETKDGLSLYDYALYVDSSEEKRICKTFNKFYPGLWKTIESEDICQLRKLINLWCKTDLHKNGVTLKDAAFETGNEEIISLILGIFDTMKMIYHILAKNVKEVNTMLENCRKKLQLDLRKMSHHGAPILYYLIKSKAVSIIELFIKHGCHVYTIMQDENGYDIPVLFTALNKDLSCDIIKALLPKNKPHQEEMLYKILYKGKTLLEYALEQNVNLQVFDVLVDRGGPLLLCDRNQFNQNVRDLALFHKKNSYAEIIDKNVLDWILYPSKYPKRRNYMALYGWDFNPFLEKKHYANINDACEFLSQIDIYQSQIKNLCDAIENNDKEKVKELKIFHSNNNLFENQLLWHGRVKSDGLPFLHRAVLFNHLELVELILQEKPVNESIDTLFDQHHRTALHYAYALSSLKQIKKILLDCGCSEHILDKKNKEPLDFKDKQDTYLINELLERLKSKDYMINEPDPWLNSNNEDSSKGLNLIDNDNEESYFHNCNNSECEECYFDDLSDDSQEETNRSLCCIQ